MMLQINCSFTTVTVNNASVKRTYGGKRFRTSQCLALALFTEPDKGGYSNMISYLNSSTMEWTTASPQLAIIVHCEIPRDDLFSDDFGFKINILASNPAHIFVL
jgi:hypothetical protein